MPRISACTSNSGGIILKLVKHQPLTMPEDETVEENHIRGL